MSQSHHQLPLLVAPHLPLLPEPCLFKNVSHPPKPLVFLFDPVPPPTSQTPVALCSPYRAYGGLVYAGKPSFFSFSYLHQLLEWDR